MRGLMGKSKTKVHKCLGFFCWLLIVSFVLVDFFYFELCSRQSFPLVFLTHSFLLPPLIFLTTIMGFGFKTIRRLLITTAVFALLIACFTQWPFFASIRFAVSKPDFVSLLNRHETKQAVELPIGSGRFMSKTFKVTQNEFGLTSAMDVATVELSSVVPTRNFLNQKDVTIFPPS